MGIDSVKDYAVKYALCLLIRVGSVLSRIIQLRIIQLRVLVTYSVKDSVKELDKYRCMRHLV